MVLADLGNKITRALRAMTESTVVDETVLNDLLKSISLALLQADVDVHLVKKLSTNIRQAVNFQEVGAGHNRRKLIQSTVIKELCNLLDSGSDPFQPKKGKCNVVMFVGLQGSGKTTSCTKYAYYWKKKGFKTCLVCADTFRAGAFDQLKQNATKARIPFYGSYTERDPVAVAQKGVEQFRQEQYEMIIVDTSGRHRQEAALFEEMQEVQRVVQPDDIVFVMDSSIGQAAKDQAKAFKDAVSVGSVIITKIDGHAKGGGALSAVAATRSPIIFVGTGEHIDDFEPFNTKSFVSRLLGMGDITGLLTMFQEKKMFEQTDLIKKITEGTGEFTFRDMREQISNVLKLGPLGKVMAMIPGLSQLMSSMGKDQEKESSDGLKRMLTILDSMSDEELDSTEKIFTTAPNRVLRVARGAGVDPRAVFQVIEMAKRFKSMAAGMQSLAKGGGLDPSKMRGKGGRVDMSKLTSMLDPRMLQQLGGAGNVQQMMKSFASGLGGGGGGGPGGLNLDSLASMMPPGFADMMGGMGGLGGLGGLGGMPGMPGMPGMGGSGGGRGRGGAGSSSLSSPD